MSSRTLFHIKIREDGRLELWSYGQSPPGVITKSNFPKSRWLHIAVVHYPHQGSHPNMSSHCSWHLLLTYLIIMSGFFIDGVLIDLVNWAYPRLETTAETGTFMIGDDSEQASMSWCVASATFLSRPLGTILRSLVLPRCPKYIV